VSGKYTRMYVKRGRVSHAVDTLFGNGGAVCGVYPWMGWYGTGSQDEYDKAASMPRCQRCPEREGGTKT
jgi:hypothetical protein